jgi:protein-disulfide isomerase
VPACVVLYYHMYITLAQQRRLVLIATAVAVTLVGTSMFLLVRAKTAPQTPSHTEPKIQSTTVRPIDTSDHVFGNPGAPIVFITYSDFLCPYCRDFYDTMKKTIETYGKDGKVAWVYRHMPITRLHPHAATYALASECVSQSAGDRGFWDFADILHATATAERVLTSPELIAFAEQVGVPQSTFTTCMKESLLMDRVEADFTDAINAGASATPFTVIVTAYQQLPRQGARSYPVVAATVEAMLRNLGALSTTPTTESMPNLFEDILDDVSQESEGTQLLEGETIE